MHLGGWFLSELTGGENECQHAEQDEEGWGKWTCED
jgi:hypothetical protein